MKLPTIGLCALALLASTAAVAEEATISRNGTRESFVGPSDYFTGTAIVDRVFEPNEQLPSAGGSVTFAPGARSAWHSHPAGQMMIVTSGTGWVQEEGGAKHEIKPGDVVWTPPGVKHWHGATESTSMTHLVLSIVKDGENVVWMEQVSDEQYLQ